MHTRTIIGLLLCFVGFCAPTASRAEDLASAFNAPPQAAKPWAYWWWLDSYATKEGITRDLEEMKTQGIAGVLLFDAGEGGPDAPKGPVFVSPAWRELFSYALREADRLGIEVSANLCSGWNAGGTWVTPEHASKSLVWSLVQVQGPGAITRELPRPKVWEDYYRDVAVVAFPESGTPVTMPATGANTLKNWELKAARTFLDGVPDKLQEEDPETNAPHVDSRQVVDLSNRMDAAGRLTWNAPAGTWTVIRFGYTLLGAKINFNGPGTKGYEIDFFSATAMDLQWAHTGAKMVADAGSLAGKTFKYVHDDSYEVAGPNRLQPNWTPEFLAEFRTRRGYDLIPYLPVLAGRIVGSRGISNRFLWDFRRTIGDLFAANHYARMHELAQAHGLGTHPESGGPFWPQIDALQTEGINDIPMGEFWKRAPEKPDGKVYWTDNYRICDTVRQAASAAHIYGKRLCQAEAFTSMGPNWEEDFFDLKDIGDRAFCAGLTRNMLCFYVHQARLDAKPGFQWEAAGTHFDRNVTWWPQIHAWLTYLSRCQHMLQQGLFVADLCYFYGEDVPNYVPAKTEMRPPLPAGYDCDTINADALLNRVTVKDHRLVLPDRMSYRLLVLPDRRTMSPRVLGKIKELVEEGATVVGRKPKHAPGLTEYPACDAEVKRLADELWGEVDGKHVKERKVGEGRVIWGRSLTEILAGDSIAADVQITAQVPLTSDGKGPTPPTVDWIHRQDGTTDIYFVSNQSSFRTAVTITFRAGGRQPEIWDPVTGERWEASDFRQGQEKTTLPLEFAPRQSLFVVFRTPIREASPPSRKPAAHNMPSFTTVAELSGPWTVRFDPAWGGPESVVFEKLDDWTKRSEPGIRYYSGKAVYEKTFDLPPSLQGSNRRIYLNLGRIKNVAEVRLDGKDLGVIWTAPWHVEITAAVQPTGNRLEIGIVNLWPNRLIGDAALPPEQRLTVTNVKKFKKDSPLLESGLLGPVTLQTTD